MSRNRSQLCLGDRTSTSGKLASGQVISSITSVSEVFFYHHPRHPPQLTLCCILAGLKRQWVTKIESSFVNSTASGWRKFDNESGRRWQRLAHSRVERKIKRDRETETERQRKTKKDRETERQRDRERDRDRDTERDSQRKQWNINGS